MTPGTIYVVRHGKAGSRSNWRGPDSARPLTAAGIRQAEAIATMLEKQPIARIVSSPYLRCRQTVEPLGSARALPVEADEALAEGASLEGIHALIAAAEHGGLVLCSHGDVIGDFLEHVTDRGADLDHPKRLEKGSVWEFEVRKGKIHRGRYHLPRMSVDAVETVDDVLAVLRAPDAFADEEDVDQLAHALQCAARLERGAPQDLELQVAGLVHDIASIAAPDTPATHAPVGGRMVRGLLGTRVAQLVSLHADAKRYLVTTDPEYRATLSRRSLETLEEQGGLLAGPAIGRMQRLPEIDDALTLRRADDAAKVPGADVPGLDHWEPVLRQVAGAAR